MIRKNPECRRRGGVQVAMRIQNAPKPAGANRLSFHYGHTIVRTLLFALALIHCHAAMAGQAGEAPIVLQGGRHQITFDPANGSILRVSDGGAASAILRSAEAGLWQAKFRDGAVLSATNFHAGNAMRRFESQREGGKVRLSYRAPEAVVVVTVTGYDGGFDFQGQITPTTNTVLEFALPGRLRFEPEQVQRFVSPLNPHIGVGAAFNSAFFKPQPADRASSWKPQNAGPLAYQHLFGGGAKMLDMNAPAVKLDVTPAAQSWFDAELSARLGRTMARVSRPSLPTQIDLVLVGSANGAFFSGSRLGGKGSLWRFGGQVDEQVTGPATDAVVSVVRKLASAPAARKKLGLVSLKNGPANGSGCDVLVGTWRERFERLAKSARLEFVELVSPEQMTAAANADEFLAILNPYGEWLPVPPTSTLNATVDAIGRFVRQGGNWFEVGGYPFYAALQPAKFLKYDSTYPPVFADFMHLDSTTGKASLYRIQPRNWKPWMGAQNPQAIFVPGRLGFAGDEQGAWCERAFGAFVTAGQTWTAPVVRLALGGSAEDDLQTYCQANGITRTLREKFSPEVFDKFRRAVLVKYDGSVKEKMASLDKLPVPALIHYSDFLKGGFDKEYPDHLPPHPSFGTPAELRAFHDRAHALGHLIMPYTNPTWWCDHPRGPTFERAGDAPLLVRLDGKPAYERYSKNDGWTITMWHPAVRAANRETLRQFTEDYPVDILFQDQCGARGWSHDLNPASPSPLAYQEGMLSLVDEQCATKPLGTEDGWDRVVNAEVQLCGFTFALGPGRRQAFAREMKTVYHPATWELYPFAQRIAHDKTALLHHDLGKFVNDRPTLAWTLGLGFAMSYRVSAKALNDPAPREWLRWVDRIQKSIAARYVGEPVGTFAHEQGGESSGDDGVIRAAYGPVRLAANLSATPRREAGRELAGYGFRATAPGLIAGNLRSVAGTDFGDEGVSFVTEGDARRAELWIYAAAGGEVAVELPEGMSGTVTVTLDGQPAVASTARDGAIRLRLPGADVPAAKPLKQLWHADVAAK